MFYHPSVAATLQEIRQRWPDAPFAAFGQTVFWDEPTKCVLLPMLREFYPNARLFVGTHDADYFGRCPGLKSRESFVVAERNDEETREMWAAAGEVSSLFGAEFAPSRADLVAAGVDIQKLRRRGEAFVASVRRHTTAWRWRAVVEPGNGRRVIREVKTSEVVHLLEKVLRQAMDETVECVSGENRAASARVMEELLGVVRSHASRSENEMLTDFYQSLWPVLYNKLAGAGSSQVRVTSTCSLFRFNRQTSARARFRLLDCFLDPSTREACRAAYSAAVEESGIYELDRFGSRAVPFELVIPGRGRGTISFCACGHHLVVHTDPMTVIDMRQPVRSVHDLAAGIERALGPDVALVGKAVALAFMFTSEFVFVLNEEGSPYVSLTRKMADYLREDGMVFDLLPVLRIRYRTWDSIGAAGIELRLPEFLADAFGQEKVPTHEFAARWSCVVEEQKRLLNTLAEIRGTQQLIEFLETLDHCRWRSRLDELMAAQEKLLNIQRAVEEKKDYADNLREREKMLKAEVNHMQRLRGQVSRTVKSLQSGSLELERAGGPRNQIDTVRAELAQHAESEMREIDERIDELRREIEATQSERKRIVAEYRALETGDCARNARNRLATIEAEAEAERLRLVSNALRTSHVLPYTNHRPTAWWFPVVSPDGAWFRALQETTELRLEPMS